MPRNTRALIAALAAVASFNAVVILLMLGQNGELHKRAQRAEERALLVELSLRMREDEADALYKKLRATTPPKPSATGFYRVLSVNPHTVTDSSRAGGQTGEQTITESEP